MYVCTPGCVNSSMGCTGGLLNALVCTETSLTSLKDTRGGVSFSMKMYKKSCSFPVAYSLYFCMAVYVQVTTT